jgi:hypothetical protein
LATKNISNAKPNVYLLSELLSLGDQYYSQCILGAVDKLELHKAVYRFRQETYDWIKPKLDHLSEFRDEISLV